MIRLLAVGRIKAPYAKAGVEEFVRRIGRFTTLEIVEVPDAGMEAEGKALLARHRTGPLIVCDRQGEPWSSQDLAAHLGRHGSSGFVIGGPDGLDPAVKGAADHLLSMGNLTLPHDLARLVLLEQIYRGFTILGGHPYHR